MADISMGVVLGMLFLILSNANIKFAEKKLTWRLYTTAKALPTIKQVKLINKKEFAKAVLDEQSKTFVVHVAALEAPLSEITIYPLQIAQIAVLQQNEVLTEVPLEYADFANIFSPNLVMKLLENIVINKYAIKLEDGKQPLYGSIYSLGLVELETLKTYIKTHLKTGFI